MKQIGVMVPKGTGLITLHNGPPPKKTIEPLSWEEIDGKIQGRLFEDAIVTIAQDVIIKINEIIEVVNERKNS